MFLWTDLQCGAAAFEVAWTALCALCFSGEDRKKKKRRREKRALPEEPCDGQREAAAAAAGGGAAAVGSVSTGHEAKKKKTRRKEREHTKEDEAAQPVGQGENESDPALEAALYFIEGTRKGISQRQLVKRRKIEVSWCC